MNRVRLLKELWELLGVWNRPCYRVDIVKTDMINSRVNADILIDVDILVLALAWEIN